MSEPSSSSAEVAELVRLPVERPQAAVSYLRSRGGGVMDLIAHFWERLSQTPPLSRADLHLVAAIGERPPEPGGKKNAKGCGKGEAGEAVNGKLDISRLEESFSDLGGVMLYVPKAYRADVLALAPGAAAAFAGYIQQVGAGGGSGAAGVPPGVCDLSGVRTQSPAEALAGTAAGGNGRCAIDFLTGEANGIGAMVPHLLPLVNKKVPARQLVNVVMQLPAEVAAGQHPAVRPAREDDLPALNRWRRLYKEERGILFDADLDAWVETKRVFVLEQDKQVAAVAKFDLDLASLVEIGGVYTFPEFRNRGLAHQIMEDLAARVRAVGKMPTLQVDETNTTALDLYVKMGWRPLGRLARVWLTGG